MVIRYRGPGRGYTWFDRSDQDLLCDPQAKYNLSGPWFSLQRLLIFFRAVVGSGTCVRIGEPTLTQHCHPKPIVSIRIYSWCSTFCGFGQICNGMYHIVSYKVVFHCPQNPLCSTYLSFPFHPWKPLIFCLFQNVT